MRPPPDEEEEDGGEQLLGVNGTQLMALLQHMGGLGGLSDQPTGVAPTRGALTDG